MRLLDTKTLKLHSFLSNSRGHIPDYAILSHRWDNKEVSFQNLESGRGKSTEGYIKIEACCAQARPDGWEYVWVDSCCIDKTSSAELSEAINSMYQWYKNAQVCYAYLRDVDTQGDIAGLDGVGSQSGIDSGSDIGYSGDSRKQFKNSTWFMRGWTLQELLAPSRVVFFDCNWIDIGTKSSLEEVISDITGIEDFLFYESACVAQKMSWAAGRKTTRVEDEAYCLMGLFGVNMPLLYGEGNNAFMRLQQEIIKTSDDESIFAWSSRTGRGGLLAESPRAFLSSGGVRPMPTVSINTIFYEERPPFTMTNRGLHISLFLIPAISLYGLVTDEELLGGGNLSASQEFIAPLNCLWAESDTIVPAIFLREDSDGRYRRAHCRELLSLDLSEAEIRCRQWSDEPQEQDGYVLPIPGQKSVYVKQGLSTVLYGMPSRTHEAEFIFINTSMLVEHNFSRLCNHPEKGPEGSPWSVTNDQELMLTAVWEVFEDMYPEVHFANHKSEETIVLLLGASRNHNPWMVLVVVDGCPTMSSSLISDLISPATMVGGSSHWKIRSHSMDVMGSDSEDSLKYGFGEGPAKTPNRASRFTGVDRISKPLKNGMSVSASLRPITKGGELRFVVDINIDPLGTIRWPTPTWFRGLETQVKDIVSKHEKTGGKLLQESRNAQVEGGGSEQAQGKWSLPLRSIPKEPERVAQDNASYKGRDEGVYAARDWTGVPEEIVMEWSRKLEPFPSLERYEDGKDF